MHVWSLALLSGLWCKLAATPIGPVAWKLRYAAGAAKKEKAEKKKKQKTNPKPKFSLSNSHVAQQVKYLALSLQWLVLLLWHRFNPRPGNSRVPQGGWKTKPNKPNFSLCKNVLGLQTSISGCLDLEHAGQKFI